MYLRLKDLAPEQTSRLHLPVAHCRFREGHRPSNAQSWYRFKLATRLASCLDRLCWGRSFGKSVAVDVDDLPEAQRQDLALLLSLVDDPLAMAAGVPRRSLSRPSFRRPIPKRNVQTAGPSDVGRLRDDEAKQPHEKGPQNR